MLLSLCRRSAETLCIVVGAGAQEPACVASGPGVSYLLDHDGLVLKYTATDDESMDPFMVVTPKFGEVLFCYALTLRDLSQ